jgi:hypothetical protein
MKPKIEETNFYFLEIRNRNDKKILEYKIKEYQAIQLREYIRDWGENGKGGITMTLEIKPNKNYEISN